MQQKTIVIGLCGGKGEGKDTLAKHLSINYGFTRMAYGDALYQEVADAFDTTVEALGERSTKETPQAHLALVHCKDLDFVQTMLDLFPDEPSDAFLNAPRSPRWALQYWGTEYRRKQNPRYWLDIVDEKVRQTGQVGRVVITDVRYPNELDVIDEYQGEARRIVLDPPVPRDETAGHSSERALDHLAIPVITNRFGDLSVLHSQADALMSQLNITRCN